MPWPFNNKANLRDLIAATGLVFLLIIGFKSLIFGPMWPGNLMEDLKKTIAHLLYTMSSFVHHFKAIGEFKMESQSGNAQCGSKLVIFFVPCDLKIWQMTLKNIRAHLLSYFKLCASFHSHLSIQNGVTVRKHQILVKIGDFCVLCDLEIWRMTLKNNRAPLLCYFKLCVSFHSLLWNQNEVTVRKHQIWVKIGNFLSRVTLKFDGWPWPFA